MWAWLAIAMFGAALANGPSEPIDEAEFRRLATEIDGLASRNAWAGVERAYVQLADAPFHASADVHVAGAMAARDRGDLQAVHRRLTRALLIDPREDVRDWLARLEATTSPVTLLGDAGSATLEADTMPFEPELAAAIRFAIAQVAETGSFEGRLPGGTYRFSGRPFELRPGISTLTLDLRSDRTLRRQQREALRLERAAQRAGRALAP